MTVFWLVIGYLGQACFTGRFAVQWLVSEKKRESVVPNAFWYFSLAGGVLLFAYSLHRGDPPYIVLQVINFGIYVRNVVLLKHAREKGASTRIIAPLVTVAALAVVTATLGRLDWTVASVPWLVCGFIGQTLWNSRFVIQWITSERRGRSVMPVAFWWVSLVGDLFLLSYSIYRLDPVYIVAFLLNPVVYVRNLMLVYRKRRLEAFAAPASPRAGKDRQETPA